MRKTTEIKSSKANRPASLIPEAPSFLADIVAQAPDGSRLLYHHFSKCFVLESVNPDTMAISCDPTRRDLALEWLVSKFMLPSNRQLLALFDPVKYTEQKENNYRRLGILKSDEKLNDRGCWIQKS
jgi:hypothetical protein